MEKKGSKMHQLLSKEKIYQGNAPGLSRKH